MGIFVMVFWEVAQKINWTEYSHFKKAIGIIAESSGLCADAFRELDLLTLPCLYIIEGALDGRSTRRIRSRKIHQSEPKVRHNMFQGSAIYRVSTKYITV